MMRIMKNTLRNLVMLIIVSVIMCGCSVSSNAYGYNDENVIVVGDTCYVYYSEPTTAFLNTLHIIDGAYFYWYADRYVPVVFPLWRNWSPYRYFYYEHNRWLWRDRISYNHWRYRRTHPWIDYRKPNRPRITHAPKHINHGNIHQNRHENWRRTYVPKTQRNMRYQKTYTPNRTVSVRSSQSTLRGVKNNGYRNNGGRRH